MKSYDIDVDRERAFLRVNVIGYWDEDTATQFVADLKKAASQLGPDHVALIDVRAAAVMPQSIGDNLARVMKDNAVPARRVAMLTSGALVKLQSVRLAPAAAPRFFTDDDEALAWLFSADPLAAT